MYDKQPVCRDLSYEVHLTPKRAAALKKWRGQGEDAPLPAGALFTSDYLGDDSLSAWGKSRDTSQP